MADKQINELTVATDISDATTFPANNNTPTYEAQQVSVGQVANFIGARANAMHNIGDVFTNKSSKVTDNPGCIPLWTGEYITNANNIYPEFYSYLKTQHPELCISRQEYDDKISTGECRYFVIDEESGSIRFPQYSYVEPDYPYIYVFNASIPQSTSQGAEYISGLLSKVSKSGDTITGSLIFGDGNGGIFPTINETVSFINLGKGGNYACFQGTTGGSVEIYSKGNYDKKIRGSAADGNWTIGGNKILDASDKAVANGVASLDSTGKIPAEQMPLSVTIRVWEE